MGHSTIWPFVSAALVVGEHDTRIRKVASAVLSAEIEAHQKFSDDIEPCLRFVIRAHDDPRREWRVCASLHLVPGCAIGIPAFCRSVVDGD